MPDAWKTKKTKKKKQQLQHPSWSQTSGLSQEFKVPRNQPPSVATFSQMEAYAKFASERDGPPTHIMEDEGVSTHKFGRRSKERKSDVRPQIPKLPTSLSLIPAYKKKIGAGLFDKSVLCEYPACNKSALGNTKFCSSHGGGLRCEHPTCMLGARGKTKFCISHGKKNGVKAKKQCKEPECETDAKSGGLCSKHQPVCKEILCTRKSRGKHGFCEKCKPPKKK